MRCLVCTRTLAAHVMRLLDASIHSPRGLKSGFPSKLVESRHRTYTLSVRENCDLVFCDAEKIESANEAHFEPKKLEMSFIL